MFPVFSAIWFNTGHMLCQFTEALELFHTFLTLVFQRNAWFDSGLLLMRHITEGFTVHSAEKLRKFRSCSSLRSSTFPS